MTTPEQRSKNAEKMRKFRASQSGVDYRQTEAYKIYRRDLKRKRRATPEGKLKEQQYSFKSALKTNYNITLEQWDRMLIEQSGRCGACNQPMIGPNEPCVDHDHDTNVVRWLLCNNCNLGLGHFKHSIDRLYGAIEYLESFEIYKRQLTDQGYLPKTSIDTASSQTPIIP